MRGSPDEARVSQSVRRDAATAEWAGAGIPLNAVAPGIITTPMTADLVAIEEAGSELLGSGPDGWLRCRDPG